MHPMFNSSSENKYYVIETNKVCKHYCGNGHMAHIPTQTRHSVIVNKHGGKLWNSTMDILGKKWMINRYLEFVNESNNVYKMKADAGI